MNVIQLHPYRSMGSAPKGATVGLMVVYGFDFIASLLEQDGYLFKLLANETGVVMLPCTTEHRDAAQPGILYADDSQGNALAAMVKPGRIEFRYHRQFSDERVRELARRMLELREFEFARSFAVTYQARMLIDGSLCLVFSQRLNP